jgi:hypothetical protein
MHNVRCSTKEYTTWIILHLKAAEGIVVTIHRQLSEFIFRPNHTQLSHFSGIEEAAFKIRIVKILVHAITGMVLVNGMLAVTVKPATNLVALFAIIDNKQ